MRVTPLLLSLALLQSASFSELGGSATGGGLSATAEASEYPSLALNAAGNPTVVWTENAVTLKRWNGSAWEGLGGSESAGLPGSAGSYNPSLALDGAGNPSVAWIQQTTNLEIYFRRWNGSAWEELAGSGSGGGLSNSAGDSSVPHVVLDSAGNPYVAWDENVASNWEIYLRRWNGVAWEELGGSGSGGGVSANAGGSQGPWVELDGSGYPVVAWCDTIAVGNAEIYLRRWDGSTWVELGGSATGGGISANAEKSYNPCLALDASGNPHVAWCQQNGIDWELHYLRWNGAAWVPNGATSLVGPLMSLDGPFYVRPTLRLGSNGAAHLAWPIPQGGGVYYVRWNGSAWEELGGSGSGGGVSGAGVSAFAASLALDSTDNPNLAWHQYTTNYEIYFKRAGGGSGGGGGGGGGGGSGGDSEGSEGCGFLGIEGLIVALVWAMRRRSR